MFFFQHFVTRCENNVVLSLRVIDAFLFFTSVTYNQGYDCIRWNWRWAVLHTTVTSFVRFLTTSMFHSHVLNFSST